MLNVKVNPVSIDVPIQAFQTYLYKKLKALWTLDDTNFEGFGRAYRNTNDKGLVPEVFVNSAGDNNTQYKAIFFDETTLKALFFFDVDDISSYKEGYETDKVSVIFITNISSLKPGLQHRGDEEVSNDIQTLVSTNFQNFILTGNETGFKNVFKAYTGLVNQDGEAFRDRHPLFCIKYNFELYFDPTQVKC